MIHWNSPPLAKVESFGWERGTLLLWEKRFSDNKEEEVTGRKPAFLQLSIEIDINVDNVICKS